MKERYYNRYRIDSARLKTWNYSRSEYYFVTICTEGRQEYFGEISNSEISLNMVGQVAKLFWKKIPEHYPFTNLDAFTIMPNHIHGIIIIDKSQQNVETQNFASLQHNNEGNKFGSQSQNLGAIVRGFKAAVKKYAVINDISFSWQSRYYDRIIRNDRELFKVRKYIVYNPNKWEEDEYFV